MTKSQQKRVNLAALSKGYRLEKVGKGSHHRRYSIVNGSESFRVPSGISGDEFTFSLQEAENWLINCEKLTSSK